MGFCLVLIAVRMPWAIALANFVLLGFRFYRRHGCVQIYVTELTPSARGRLECILFFFLGQAVGLLCTASGWTTSALRRYCRSSQRY
jgi:hypothetical protein